MPKACSGKLTLAEVLFTRPSFIPGNDKWWVFENFPCSSGRHTSFHLRLPSRSWSITSKAEISLIERGGSHFWSFCCQDLSLRDLSLTVYTAHADETGLYPQRVLFTIRWTLGSYHCSEPVVRPCDSFSSAIFIWLFWQRYAYSKSDIFLNGETTVYIFSYWYMTRCVCVCIHVNARLQGCILEFFRTTQYHSHCPNWLSLSRWKQLWPKRESCVFQLAFRIRKAQLIHM